MHTHPSKRIQAVLALAVIITLVVPWAVFADEIVPDGDVVAGGDQASYDFGTVAPGASLSKAVSFKLVCDSKKHVDEGQTLTLKYALMGQVIPADGTSGATDATIGAIGAAWPDDGTDCPATPPTPIGDNGDSMVTLKAPTTPGSYKFIVKFDVFFSGAVDDVKARFVVVTYDLTVAAPTDTTPPVITPSIVGTLGSDGWYTSDVTVSWTVTDPDSTITSTSGCGTTNITADTTGTTLTCTATSAGGTSSQSVTIKRDATPPTISAAVTPDAAPSGWWNISTGAPTVSFTCNDDTSLIASCTDPYTFPGGENQSYTGTAVDNAGNSATAEVTDIDVDLTAPNVIITPSRDPDHNGWYNAPVGFSFSSSDPTAVCDDSVNFTGPDSATASVSGSCTDTAGNIGTNSASFQFDDTDPTISALVSPARPASGWWNIASGAPTVSFTCGDATADIESCTASHLFGEGENQSYTGTAVDNAGNSATAEVTDIDVDLTAPSMTWNGGPADGGSYYFGSVPAAPTCTATDSLSGPNGCGVSGYATTVGSHTMTATAHDMADNSKVETRTYTVLAWTLNGFYQPVDMGGVWNTVKGGSTVPLKFEVFAATELTDVSVVKSFAATPTACPTTNFVADEIEFITTGGTTLRYDPVAGQFIQNWQTPKKPGSCYKVTMTTQDDSTLVAYFKLK